MRDSIQVLYRLVNLYNISIDEYLLPNINANRSTQRRQLDTMLDTLSEKELIVVEGTVKGICQAKEPTED